MSKAEDEDNSGEIPSNWVSFNSTSGSTINTTGTTAMYYYPCTACGIVGLHNCTGYTYRTYPYYVYSTSPRCPYCDAVTHTEAEKCSRVKLIKYREDGTIKSIRFHKDS